MALWPLSQCTMMMDRPSAKGYASICKEQDETNV
ncbi:hypothetical protein GGQ62_001193 [Polymorphobacter fuscus]|nr:hypothetical protein [Polymorphobacter fuscus]